MMSSTKAVIQVGKIEQRILLIRGEKVIIDADLAEFYGVPTKRLNEQVKRNKDRFPKDFMFQLSPREKAEVVANCDHLSKLKFSKALPYAFAEHKELARKIAQLERRMAKLNKWTQEDEMNKKTRREFIACSVKILAGLSMAPIPGCVADRTVTKGMLQIPKGGYPLFEVGGSYREIGKQTALLAGDIIKRYVQVSPEFDKCVTYLKKNGKQRLLGMVQHARASLPGPVEEIEGLAEGLGIPFLEIFALNCKSEIGVLTRAYGCSTLGWRRDGRMVLAHNEDGKISDVGNMFLLKVTPTSEVKFLSFVYPGLLPGVGPTVNSCGIVQTTNYIHPRRVFEGIPRYFIARAILESKSLDQAVSLATLKGRAFPCHHNIASLKEARLLSIETFPGRHHILEVQGGHLHTNHFVHPEMSASDPKDGCVPYESSTTRYRVLMKAIKSEGHPPTTPAEMIKLLSLHDGRPHSPCRHPAGRIQGVTLGTAIFEAPELAMTLYHGNPCLGNGRPYWI